MVGGVEIGSQSKWDPEQEGSGTCGEVQMGSRGRGSRLVQEGEADSRVEEMEQGGESESRLEMGVRWGHEQGGRMGQKEEQVQEEEGRGVVASCTQEYVVPRVLQVAGGNSATFESPFLPSEAVVHLGTLRKRQIYKSMQIL